MSGGDYRNRPSLHIPGKEFLIVIVVVFSSLSFTLGYFVGKSNKEVSSAPTLPPAETASPQKSAETGYTQPLTEAPVQAEHSVTTGSVSNDAPAAALPDKPVSGPDNSEKEAAAKPSSSQGNLQKSRISYTVQRGALSNERDAEDFRVKYEKKGYKAYVVPARNKRGETIYKIRIGEFNSRKSAELLSVRLRKTEGLNTFVTFKDE
jgi:cell division septation protein DedD